MPRITYRRNPAGAVKQLSGIARDAMREAVRHWHQVYLPMHFTVAGEKRYAYQLRSGQGEPRTVPGHNGRIILNRKYWWRKVRQQRTDRPLVWSGASEGSAQGAVKFSVRRQADGTLRATVAMPVPDYFYKYKPGQPDKQSELTRTIPEEQEDLRGVIERSVARHLSNVRGVGDVS